jgi:hypothetical protein
LAISSVVLDEQYRADDFSIPLGHPAPLPPGIEVLDEGRGDARDHRLETFVQAVCLGIEHAVTMDYPTHVARLMGTKHVRGITGLASIAEQSLYCLERSYQPRLLGTAQLTQHCCDLIVGAGVDRREGFAAPVGEGEDDLPAISVRRALFDQTSSIEAAEDAAGMPCRTT